MSTRSLERVASADGQFIGFVIDVPSEWSVESWPDTELLVADAAEPGRFRSNVAVRASAVEADVSVDDVAASALHAASESLSDFKLLDDRPIDVDGGSARAAVCSFVENGLQLFQTRLFLVPSGVGFRGVLEVTGTCPAVASSDYAPIFGRASCSLRVTPIEQQPQSLL